MEKELAQGAEVPAPQRLWIQLVTGAMCTKPMPGYSEYRLKKAAESTPASREVEINLIIAVCESSRPFAEKQEYVRNALSATAAHQSVSEQAQRAAEKIDEHVEWDIEAAEYKFPDVDTIAAIIEEEMGKTAGEDPQKTLPLDKS